MEELKIIYLPPGELTPYAKNAKRHPEAQVQHIANSIKEFGFRQPIVVDADNVVVIGHGRLLAAKLLGMESVPVVRADDLTEAQIKALRLADNKTNESEWEPLDLEAELADLALDFDMADFGFDDLLHSTDYDTEGERKGSLAERFLVPPFSVIYANKPDWLARKRAWVDFGIRSELGRGGTCLQFTEQSRGKLHTSGGAERSKAFKNNTRLNSYMSGARH